jgi:hypothetical protein
LTVDTDTSKSGNGRPLDPTSLYQVQYSPWCGHAVESCVSRCWTVSNCIIKPYYGRD